MSRQEGKSWLDGDPQLRDLRARMHKTPPSRAVQPPRFDQLTAEQQKRVLAAREKLKTNTSVPAKPAKKLELQISVKLPKLPKLKRPTKLSRRHMTIGAIAVAVVLVGGIGTKVLTGVFGDEKQQTGVLGGVSQQPDYDFLLPSNKVEDTESDGYRYDPEKKVTSFTDKIGKTSITVSQQPLPEAFKQNPQEELEKIATGFSATDIINESNPKAYLGTSEQGPQTVILIKNEVLVFITSTTKIDKSDWAAYITQLL